MLNFQPFIVYIRPTSLIITLFLTLCGSTPVFAKDSPPQLGHQNGETQLLIGGKPYYMLGGELGNSSASSMDYMDDIWPKLKKMHINTLLVPVYWELIEPKEGEFNFTLLEKLIKRARKEDLKLTLLWFASWKNSMSTYVPSWVKRNQNRFPRAVSADGASQEILSPFSKNNLHADKKAFVAMMAFLKKFDASKQTVIMIQVENEIGMLPSARDYTTEATNAYAQPVPKALINYMQKNKGDLTVELIKAWETNDFKMEGSWAEVFGANLASDELFIAWYFARYTNEIASAGKAVYPLPMIVNAALNRPNVDPGKYPSGGPLPHLMDVWKAGAPSIDLLVPDFYNPRFKHWNDLYTQQGDALLIPEIRFDSSVGAKALFAFGEYNCLGFSPFSIESTNEPSNESLTHSYNLLKNVFPLLSTHSSPNTKRGVWLTKDKPSQTIVLGDYELTIKHDLTLGWSPKSKDKEWSHSGGILIHNGENDYTLIGTGLVITVKPASHQGLAGIDQYHEGNFIKGKWVNGRSLNGDQSHQGRHLRIPHEDWQIQKIRLYQYK